jgi:hypothetical protein
MSSSDQGVVTGFWPDLKARLRRRRKTGADSPVVKDQAQPESKKRWNNTSDSILASSRLVRSRRVRSKIHSQVIPILSTVLPIISILWLLALPLDRWGRTTYFDENAIQPGQVKTYWDWGDVHLADQWLAGIEKVWKNGQGTSEELVLSQASGYKPIKTMLVLNNLYSLHPSPCRRADYLVNKLRTLNIPADTQEYTYTSTSPVSRRLLIYPTPADASGVVISIKAESTLTP